MSTTTIQTKEFEDRVLRLAEQMTDCYAKGYGVSLSDSTSTVWDLTHVSPRVRKLIEAAAEIADLRVEISKVGDDARVRILGETER